MLAGGVKLSDKEFFEPRESYELGRYRCERITGERYAIYKDGHLFSKKHYSWPNATRLMEYHDMLDKLNEQG